MIQKKEVNMRDKKIMTEENKKEIFEEILTLVREENLTFSNLKDIVDEIEEYMADNALLNKKECR